MPGRKCLDRGAQRQGRAVLRFRRLRAALSWAPQVRAFLWVARQNGRRRAARPPRGRDKMHWPASCSRKENRSPSRRTNRPWWARRPSGLLFLVVPGLVWLQVLFIAHLSMEWRPDFWLLMLGVHCPPLNRLYGWVCREGNCTGRFKRQIPPLIAKPLCH